MTIKVEQKMMEERIHKDLELRFSDPGSISALLTMELVSCDADAMEATLSHVIDKRELNIYDILHGGIITWLVDSAMGITCRSCTGYEHVVTLDIHVNFLRAVHEGDKAIIKTKMTHAGSKVMNLISELYVDDKLSASADAVFYKVD